MLWVLGSTHYSMAAFRDPGIREPLCSGNSPGSISLVAANLLTENKETIPWQRSTISLAVITWWEQWKSWSLSLSLMRIGDGSGVGKAFRGPHLIPHCCSNWFPQERTGWLLVFYA